jgi:hypothetical protein
MSMSKSTSPGAGSLLPHGRTGQQDARRSEPRKWDQERHAARSWLSPPSSILLPLASLRLGEMTVPFALPSTCAPARTALLPMTLALCPTCGTEDPTMPGGGGSPAAQRLAFQMNDFHPGRSPKPGAFDRHLAGLAQSLSLPHRDYCASLSAPRRQLRRRLLQAGPASPRPALPCSGTSVTSKPPAAAGAPPTPSGARGRRGTCCRPPRYPPGVRGRRRTRCGPPRYPASPRGTRPARLRPPLPLLPPSPELRAPRFLTRPPRLPGSSYPSSTVPGRAEGPAPQAPPLSWPPPPRPPVGRRL